MKVLALSGDTSVGKTSTLNIVYQLLLNSGYNQVPGHFLDLANRDFLDVLQKGEEIVGIVTQGDYVIGLHSVKSHLQKLKNIGCVKTICACTTRNPKIKINIQAYSLHIFINKTQEPKMALQRIADNAIANQIIASFRAL